MSESAPVSKHSEAVGKATRDQLGRFVSFSEDKTGEELVDIKVHNPLKRLYQLLIDIKNKQITKVNLKFEIPLIVILILTGVVLGIGSISAIGKFIGPVCQTSEETHVGKFNIFIFDKQLESSWFKRLFFLAPTPDFETTTQAILRETSQNTEILFTFKLDSELYHNQEIAVYGKYNPCERRLTVKSPRNIVILERE